MSGVGTCTSRDLTFTRQDEEDLRREPTTTAILDKARRDAGVGGPRVDVRGDDKTWRETKTEQQKHFGVAGGVSVLHAGAEAAHLAEFQVVETFTAAGAGASVGAGLVAGGAVLGLGLGIYEWAEAHHKGDEQRVALTKDELHVAMLTQLDLPKGYKAEQLKERGQAGQGEQSAALRTALALATVDKPLVSAMQHHADIGAHAARDFLESGLEKKQFLAAHPAIDMAYKKDPAFHDGFDALVWAKEQSDPSVYKKAVDSVLSRDPRCSQTTVTFRP